MKLNTTINDAVLNINLVLGIDHKIFVPGFCILST